MSEQKIVDPLLACLVIFTKIHHRPFSAEALTQGLPVQEGESTPKLFSRDPNKALFSRAAARGGFTSKLVERSLENISPLVLPVILLLKDGDACVLEELDIERGEAKVILPDLPDAEEWINLDKLQKLLVGMAKLDRVCKGQTTGDAWLNMEQWCVRFCK